MRSPGISDGIGVSGMVAVNKITGETVALTGSQGLDFEAMLKHGREVGGPALRAMTFHQRAFMIKAIAQAIIERKDELYELSYQTGSTRTDSWIDIEGGIGIADSKKRELVRSALDINQEIRQFVTGSQELSFLIMPPNKARECIKCLASELNA